MADEKTEVVDEVQADKDFAEGFSAPDATLAAPLKTEKPVEGTDPPAPAAGAAPADPVDPPAPSPVAAPEYVQITKEQFASLEAAAAKVGDFDKKFDKAFGTVGGMQDVIKQLQDRTPQGEAVVIDDAMFAEMAEDYPALAQHFRTAIEKILKGAKGTSTSSASVDPAAVTKLIADGIKQREIEALEDDHPDWRDIVGAVDSPEKADPKNKFRVWLSTQPAAYAAKVTSTHSASVLAKAIEKFKEATKTPSPAAPKTPDPKLAARKNRIEGAVSPKGDGNPPPPTKTADDEFAEGYRTG